MPSGTDYKISSVAKSQEVMNRATFEGAAFGDAHRTANKAFKKLGKGESEFPLSADSLPTRGDKFVGTFMSFEKGAACFGTGALGNGLMLPVDLVLGHGRVRSAPMAPTSTTLNQKGSTASTSASAAASAGNIFDKGLLGHGLEAVVTGTSLIAEVGGAIAGSTVALASTPAAPISNKGFGTWLRSGAQKGGQIAGSGAAIGLGTPAGLALTAARIPSMAVKYALGGAMAVATAPIAFLAASTRAIINK